MQVFSSVAQDLKKQVFDAAAPIIANEHIILTGQAAGSKGLETAFRLMGAKKVDHLPTSTPKKTSIAHQLDQQNRELSNPDISWIAQLDNLDERSKALIYAGSCANVHAISGRRVLAARKKEWYLAEQKQQQVQLTNFQQHFIQKYICTSKLADGLNSIDKWIGQNSCVFSGVSKDYLAMGSSDVFLLPADSECIRKRQFLDHVCVKYDAVRISMYSVGRPATFYGYVIGDDTVIFGPVSALLYWNPNNFRIHAPGILSAMAIDLLELNEAKKQIAYALRKLVKQCGYVGGFGVDGCFTGDGFIIHEINPRVCAGFAWLAKAMQVDFPLALIDLVLRERKVGTEQIMACLRALVGCETLIRYLALWGAADREFFIRRLDNNKDIDMIVLARTTEALKSVLPEGAIPFLELIKASSSHRP